MYRLDYHHNFMWLNIYVCSFRLAVGHDISDNEHYVAIGRRKQSSWSWEHTFNFNPTTLEHTIIRI